MTSFDDPLRGGACVDLLPEVVDKFFFAKSVDNPFEYYTAKVICGRCAVRGACLTQAVAHPNTETLGGMIRGGENATTIRNMRHQYLISGQPLREIVATALATQTVPEVAHIPRLREGRFPDTQTLTTRS